MSHRTAVGRVPLHFAFPVLVSCLLTAGCDRAPAPPAADSAVKTAPAASQPDQDLQNLFPAPPPSVAGDVIPDHSLTGEKYIELGVPASDRTWMGDDMKHAAEALRTLEATHPDQLPRFESTRSGAVFARIVSTDNLKFFRHNSLPLDSRFPPAIAFMQSHNLIVVTYLDAFLKRGCPGDELIELMGSQLRICRMMFDLTDEFWPTISVDDPSYAVRRKGLETMKSGLANVIMGSITTVTEDQNYSLPLRLKMLEYCRQEFPGIVPKLAAGSQTEVQLRINKLVDDPKLKPLHDQLQLLRDETVAAVKAAQPAKQ